MVASSAEQRRPMRHIAPSSSGLFAAKLGGSVLHAPCIGARMLDVFAPEKRTFRPCVLAWRTNSTGPWAAPRLRATGHDACALGRPRRPARVRGLSRRRYAQAPAPRLLRGWTTKPDGA